MNIRTYIQHRYDTYDFDDGDGLSFEEDVDYEVIPRLERKLRRLEYIHSISFKNVDSSKIGIIRRFGETLSAHATIHELRVDFTSVTDLSFLEKWPCNNIELTWHAGEEPDFSPLANIDGLENLYLNGINGDTIDLSLLIIDGLKKLHLDSINGDTIDLSVFNDSEIEGIYIGYFDEDECVRASSITLPQSSKLRGFGIIGANIEEIDLTPMSNCPLLESLSIARTPLTEIDISPLSKCKELKYLDVCFNLIETIDLTPLLACPDLSRVSFGDKVGRTLIIQRSQMNDTTPELIRKLIKRKDIFLV